MEVAKPDEVFEKCGWFARDGRAGARFRSPGIGRVYVARAGGISWDTEAVAVPARRHGRDRNEANLALLSFRVSHSISDGWRDLSGRPADDFLYVRRFRHRSGRSGGPGFRSDFERSLSSGHRIERGCANRGLEK